MSTEKDLKKLGLIAGKKKSNQMIKLGVIMWFAFIFVIIYSLAT